VGEDVVGDEVFTSPVSFNDGADEVLGYVLVVGEELFGVFG
jgi:hypothetical protein